jgi:hypothetical protein
VSDSIWLAHPLNTDLHFAPLSRHSKEDCTDGPWEYVYSHNNDASTSILDAGNPNVNMYIGCKGAQELAQSIMRTVLIDDNGRCCEVSESHFVRENRTPA